MHFQEFWYSCAQNKTSEISKNAPSGILGLLCAEQNVRNLKNCTFRNYATPVRRRKVSLDSGSQNKTSEISKNGSYVLVLNKVHVLALNTAHVLRLNKADVLALNKAHVFQS